MQVLIKVFSLSGKMVLQKDFLQLLCLMRRLCSLSMLVIWWREEYEMTGKIVSFVFGIYLHYF